MMKLIGLIILIFNVNSYAGVGSFKLSKKDISEMSYLEVQKLRNAYIKFLIDINKTTRLSGSGEKKFSYTEDFIKYLNKSISAYAMDDGSLCFFGGWPSKMKGDLCQHPSRNSDDPMLKELGVTYNRDYTCGQVNSFRCNPVLFGNPNKLESNKVHNVEVLQEPNNGLEKGYCVVINNYDELTQKCEQASQDSVEDIISTIQNDEAKMEQIENLNNLILGEQGFCKQFSVDYKKEYDACDDLKKRLEALRSEQNANSKKEGQEQADQPDNTYSQALSILNECNKYLAKDTNDVFQRNIIQKIQGGIVACRPQTASVASDELNASSLARVALLIDRNSFLQELNEEQFKSQVIAYMTADRIINKEVDKERILRELSKSIKIDDQFLEVFNESFEQFATVENQTDDILEAEIKSYNEKAITNNNSLQKQCEKIYEEYQSSKFSKSGRNRRQNKQRQKERHAFWTAKNSELKHKLDQIQSESQLGFLFNTDTFEDEVVDGDYDFENFNGKDFGFGRECAKNKNFKITKTLTPNTLKKAINEVKNQILESMDELADDFSNNRVVDNAVDDYLKYQPSVVLNTLLKNKNSNQEYAKYICGRTKKIYQSDKILNYGAIAGGSALMAVGGLTCLVPIPGARAACAAMVSTGASLALPGAGTKMQDGHKRDKGNELAAMKGDISYSEFIDEDKITDNQVTDSATTIAEAVAVPAFLKVVTKGSKAAKLTGTSKPQSSDVTNPSSVDIPFPNPPRPDFDPSLLKMKPKPKKQELVVVDDTNSGGAIRNPQGTEIKVKGTEIGEVKPTTGTEVKAQGTEVGEVRPTSTQIANPSVSQPSSRFNTRARVKARTRKSHKLSDSAKIVGSKTNVYKPKNVNELKEAKEIIELPSEVFAKQVDVNIAKTVSNSRTTVTKADAEKFFEELGRQYNVPKQSNKKIYYKKVYKKVSQKLHSDKVSDLSDEAREVANHEFQLLERLKQLVD